MFFKSSGSKLNVTSSFFTGVPAGFISVIISVLPTLGATIIVDDTPRNVPRVETKYRRIVTAVPHPDSVVDELPLVELCGRLLSTVLGAELRADEEARRAERAEVEALIDPLTGLVNRRAWGRLLAAEEARSRRHGHPACVISVDIDGLKAVNDQDGHIAGDLLLVAAARALEQSTREQDVVARVGGDEFAILCVESDVTEGKRLVDRLRAALHARGVSASIGIAMRGPETDLAAAFEAADALMYDDKRGRRGG